MPLIRLLLAVLVLIVISSCSSSNADDLNGTWDYVFEPAQGELVVAEFSAEGLIESADEVTLRLGFDDDEVWLGFLFDGELFLMGGAPEGARGTVQIDGDLMTVDEGFYETVFGWNLSGDSLTLTWVSACDKSGTVPQCTEVRTEDHFFPVGATATTDLPVITYTKSSDDPSY